MEAAGRPRTPGLVYTALAVTLVVIVAVVALTARQTPPPTIAEFAPQAQQQIKDAPSEQSSQFGSGAGGTGVAGEAGTPTPVPTPAPKGAKPTGSVHHCVGDPPRQTDDPQSPPCVAYWEGNNGGDLGRGVKANQINIYIPTDTNIKSYFQDLQDFFNLRYEFYGRHLNFIVSTNGAGATGSSNVAQQQAEADVAVQQDSFASNFYRAAGGFAYTDSLARRHVVNVTGMLIPFSNPYLTKYDTTSTWQYFMPADVMFANTGEWACKRLNGKPAKWAGDAALQTTPRKFGILLQTYTDDDPTTTARLEEELRRCNADFVPGVKNPVRTDTSGVDPVGSRTAIQKMIDAHVTSVICMCQLFTQGDLMRAASSQGYHPEWIVGTYGGNDHNLVPAEGGWPNDQTQHAFGITFQPRQVRPEDEPYFWAVKEVDPAYSDAGDSSSVATRYQDYRALQLLAAGIQMAGPKLNEQTFASGLQRAAFPNPDHRIQAGKVGFPGGLHGETIDGAEFWWLPNGASPYTGGDAAAACYLGAGKRYGQGQWPAGDPPFFQLPCDSGA